MTSPSEGGAPPGSESPPRNAAALDRLVRRRVSELALSTASTGVPPSLDALADVARLERIRDLAAAKERLSLFRWQFVLALLASVLVVLFAATCRVPSVLVEVTFDARAIALEPASRHFLAAPINVLSARANGLRAVELSPVIDSALRAAIEEAAALETLAIARAPGRRGSIDVGEVELGPGERAVFSCGSSPRSVRITLGPASSSGQGSADLALDGELVLEGADRDGNREDRRLSFPTPEPVALRPATGTALELELELDSQPVLLAEGLAVRRLDFALIESNGPGVEVKRSTLTQAKLAIPSLPESRRELGRSDILELVIDRGELDELQSTPDGLRGRFTGRASRVAVEAGGIERSLKPTVLEWLTAARPVQLVWGGAAWLLGLFFTAYRWWSKPT